MPISKIISLARVVRALVVVTLALCCGATVQGQSFPVWTGSGTNWSSSPTNWSPAFGYGQLQWANAGSTTSWNNLGTVSMWRFYFSGNTSYTVGGGDVNFFDWSGTNGGILVGASDGLSTGNQTINLNVSFRDSGARTAFILTRGSGTLTFNGSVEATNGVTALGIGGTNTNGVITFNGALTGNKPIVVGTNSLNGGVAGMTNTRAVFAGDNTYTGETRVVNGILTIAHDNALGSADAGTVVSSGAALHMSNDITVTGEALTLSGSLSAGVLRSVSGDNAYLGTITLGTAITSIGAATDASLTLSNVNGGANQLWIVGDGNTTIAGVYTSSATSTLVKTNLGILIMAGASDLSGNKFIRQGTIQLANDDAFSSAGTVILGGLSGTTEDAALELAQGITYSGNVSIQPQAVVGGSRTLAYNAGTGTGTLAGDIALSNSVIVDVAAGGALHSSGGLSGPDVPLIVKTGGGEFIASGAAGANKVRLADGTIVVGANDALSTSTSTISRAIDMGMDGNDDATANNVALYASNGVTVSNSIYVAPNIDGATRTLGTADADATVTFDNEVFLHGDARLVAGAGSEAEFSGNLISTGGIQKDGEGTVSLTGDNSFSGDTTVSAGTLVLNASSGAALGGTDSVTVNSGAVLLIATSNQINDDALVTLSGGTIQRADGVGEVFGDINITASSTLDFGSGAVGTFQFQTYNHTSGTTMVANFTPGNRLQFLDSSFNEGDLAQFNFGSFAFTTGTEGSYFTITAIPEPSTVVAALGLAGLMLWPARRRLLKDAKSILGLRPTGIDRARAYRHS